MNRNIKLLFIVMSCLILVACNSHDNSTLKIGVLRTVDSVPLYLADRENYFKQAGVNVDLIEFGSASDQSKAMEAGELDGIMTDMVVQSLIQKGGTDIRVVSGLLGSKSTEGRFALVVAPNSKIKSIEDLAGKRIAIAKGTMMEYLLDSYLNAFGIDKTMVVKEQIPKLSLRLDMVLKGKDIDGAILPDPLVFFAESKGAYSIIDDTKLEKNFSQSVLAFKKETIETKREDINNCLKAYQEAVGQLNSMPSKYEKYFKEVVNMPEDILETYKIPTYTQGWVPTENEVSALMKWMVEVDLLESSYQYNEIVDDSFIKK